MSKHFFDILFSFLGIVILSPVVLIISVILLISSKGKVFFVQRRAGKNNRSFKLAKFRTMKIVSDNNSLITIGVRDPRLTNVGYFLRKYKLDELPQLFNILKGDMSFVGPRPEVPKYVEFYTEEQKKVLDVRPGLTDYASLKFFDENRILAEYDNPEKAYIEQVLPEKLNLSLKYIEEQSFLLDLKLIWLTIKRVFTSPKQKGT